MLPRPSPAELRRRVPRLLAGLVFFGLGLAFMVAADLGLAPWEVLHQGLSRRTGIPIGTMGIITGVFVLAAWIPLREKPGLGTVANVVVIGVVIDLTLWGFPDVTSPAGRWALLVAGLAVIGLGSGLYIGAGMGPGPRDGLMTGIARRGYRIGVVRTAIEVAVLVAGWLLGGTVGVGTVAFSFGIGPLVGFFLPRLMLEPVPARAPA